MALVLTFDQLKTEILLRASRRETCEAYSSLYDALDNTGLLAAGCGNFAWAYQNVITDDLVLEFTEAELNSFGIYSSGTVTLTDPQQSDYVGCKGVFLETEDAQDNGQEIYAVLNVDLTVNISTTIGCTVYAMGNSNVTINITGNGKCNLKVFNDAVVTVNISNNGNLCFEVNDLSITTISAQDNAVSTGAMRFKSYINYTGSNTSFSKIKMFAKSVLDYVLNDTAGIDVLNINSGIINGVLT